MSLPGCRLRFVISAVESPAIRCEFDHSSVSKVDDTTYSGVLFIKAAIFQTVSRRFVYIRPIMKATLRE
jgi:hypothetical protein